MRTRIGTRLILGVGLVTALSIGIMAALIMRIHEAQLEFELTRSADQLSEAIQSSTRDDMLENRRDNLHRQIRNIGALQGEGIRKVRLFNKEGRIMFSSCKEEIGTALDKRGEACYGCHAEGEPLKKLDIRKRSRIFNAGDGTRVLGIINPVPNASSCSTAACHAHSPQESVLGVLDVQVSMAAADQGIEHSRRIMVGLAILAVVSSGLIIWWLNRRLVLAPVAALLRGTRRVAAGDLNTAIEVQVQGELGDLAAAFNSMTQRISESQRQLTQADKLASLGRLAAGVAHEINNPLTGVLTYASLLERRLQGDAQGREDIAVIIRETLRCRLIIRELLDFARPTTPFRKPSDINEVVHHALAVVTNAFSTHQVERVLDLGAGLPLAFADANQIEQVVVNLLLNAADAVGTEGGRIRIQTRLAQGPPRKGSEAPSCLELQVEDNGMGISPRDLPHLFEPFFSTKGNRGTGLGLAVTWGIVESHGGAIDVESQEGHWSRFTLRLPLAPLP